MSGQAACVYANDIVSFLRVYLRWSESSRSILDADICQLDIQHVKQHRNFRFHVSVVATLTGHRYSGGETWYANYIRPYISVYEYCLVSSVYSIDSIQIWHAQTTKHIFTRIEFGVWIPIVCISCRYYDISTDTFVRMCSICTKHINHAHTVVQLSAACIRACCLSIQIELAVVCWDWIGRDDGRAHTKL